MGKKRGRKDKNKTVTKSSKIKKSSANPAPNPAPTSNKKKVVKKKVISKNSSAGESTTTTPTAAKTDLFSSVFGSSSSNTTTNTTDIFSSIFGKDSKSSSSSANINNSTFDLFSSSNAQKLEQVSKRRIEKNQKNTKCSITTNNIKKGSSDLNSNTTRETIINKRKNRTLSKSSIESINSITVCLPELDYNDDDDDDDMRNGVMRLFTNQSDAIMRDKGVLILKSSNDNNDNGTDRKKNVKLFDTELLKSMSKKSKEIESDVCTRLKTQGKIWQVEQNQNQTKNQDRNTTVAQLEKDQAFQYHEVASRCLGRLDIRYGMDQQPFSNESIINNTFLMPIIKSLLGKSVKLVYAGLILSFPQSADQPWHQDGTALFDDDDDDENTNLEMVHLPPYALNVFIPLDDIIEELGPTEFFVGSHFSDVAKDIMQSLPTSTATSTTTKITKEETVSIGPLLKRGNVLIYDYRICHRGTSNLSNNMTRPMLYLMYARPWFYEHLNFGKDKLFKN